MRRNHPIIIRFSSQNHPIGPGGFCLDQAELRSRQKRDLTLDYWRQNVDHILEFNEQPVLNDAGSVSREQMKEIAEGRYADFDTRRRQAEAIEADTEDLKAIEELERDLKRKGTGNEC